MRGTQVSFSQDADEIGIVSILGEEDSGSHLQMSENIFPSLGGKKICREILTTFCSQTLCGIASMLFTRSVARSRVFKDRVRMRGSLRQAFRQAQGRECVDRLRTLSLSKCRVKLEPFGVSDSTELSTRAQAEGAPRSRVGGMPSMF